jgi:tetratricopeptide (TPR) repeat protein/predicted Ser/Thr protein kinase
MATPMNDLELETRELSKSERFDETSSSLWSPDQALPKRGDIVGRYVVLDQVGAGAMGVVLAAYDPDLDRKVALKLLKTHDDGTGTARKRLQQEAQALAKLDHPNVVAVHDVGVHDGRVFLAMEFVSGQTLREWLTEPNGPRARSDVLRVFAAAGRGLAAAHGAGLVHRDFKPDNVMIGADGRVRVLDFGLARLDESGPEDETSEGSREVARSASREQGSIARLTQTGRLLGTPAYMPLEQHEGTPATAASDQFSFCVALYEGLYGERPFAGGNIAELWDAVKRGAVRPAPKRSSVPSWLRKVVTRGLATRPEERYESMQALLDALEADPSGRRRRWLLGAGLTAVLVGASWGVYTVIEREIQMCANSEEHLAGVWDDERRAAVKAGIEGTGLSYAADTWTSVEKELDKYSAAWVEARTDACEASRRGEQSNELLDRRMACLDKRLARVGAQVEILANADNEVAINAVSAVYSLPTLDYCSNSEALMQEIAPPQDLITAARVKVLDEELEVLKALQSDAKITERMDKVKKILAEAKDLEYEPLEARAWLLEGQLQKSTGSLDESVTSLARAYHLALSLRMMDDAAEASSQLIYVLGVDLGKFEEARRWITIADPLSRAAGTDSALSIFHHSLGTVAFQQGNYPEAREHLTRSLEIDEEKLGSNHLNVAISLVGLGNLEQQDGNYDAAKKHFLRALPILEQALGQDHPMMASALNGLGIVALEQSKYKEALEHHQRAYAIREQALAAHSMETLDSLLNLASVAEEMENDALARHYCQLGLDRTREHLGADHPLMGMFLGTLGNLAKRRGELESARDYLEQALGIFEAKLGEDHFFVTISLGNLANVVYEQGDLDEARRLHERAVALVEKNHGSEHRDLGESLVGLGHIARKQGRYDEARSYYEHALKVYELSLGSDHPNLGAPLTGLGQLSLILKAPEQGIPQLERALRIREAGDNAAGLAETRFILAQALWEADPSKGRDRSRAVELARSASSLYRELGIVAASQLSEADVWLAAHADQNE